MDLLDLGPLTPFVQQGMRSAFLIAVLISIGALYVVHPTDLEDRAGIAAYVAGTLLFGIAVLLLPLDGLRRRLRLEKSHALAQLRGALATERDAALTAGDAAERARAGLQGLLALEARLRSVREWQLSAPSLARFSLYMVLAWAPGSAPPGSSGCSTPCSTDPLPDRKGRPAPPARKSATYCLLSIFFDLCPVT